jgi:hypothetical protein
LVPRFSFSVPKNKEGTLGQPPKGQPAVMTFFVENPEKVKNIESVQLAINNNKKSGPIKVEKINDKMYATKPTEFPEEKFKIVVNAVDNKNHKISVVPPSKFQTIDPSNY